MFIKKSLTWNPFLIVGGFIVRGAFGSIPNHVGLAEEGG